MLSFSWNTGFEATPSSSISRSSIDDNIRLIGRGIRERMEREHNWGYNTDSDDGTHIPGKTTVMLKGDAATRDALSDMQVGALYFLEDGTTKELWYYSGSAWVKIGSNDHGDLDNLYTDNGYPDRSPRGHDDIYIDHETETFDDDSVTVDMDGNKLFMNAFTGAEQWGVDEERPLRARDHLADGHDVVGPGAIPDAFFDVDTYYPNCSYMYDSVSGLDIITVELPLDITGITGIYATYQNSTGGYVGSYVYIGFLAVSARTRVPSLDIYHWDDGNMPGGAVYYEPSNMSLCIQYTTEP